MKQNCFIFSNWKVDMNEHFPLLGSTKDIDCQKKVGLWDAALPQSDRNC